MLFKLLLLYALIITLPRSVFKSVVANNNKCTNVIEYYAVILKPLDINFIKVRVANERIPNLAKACIAVEKSDYKQIEIVNTGTESIETGAFTGYQQLEILIIRDNAIKQLPANPFNVSSLKTLIFTNNQLEHLHEKAFQGVPNLYKLDLSRNRLRNLEPMILQSISKLHHINLSKNNFQYVRPRIFAYLNRFADDVIMNESGILSFSTIAFPKDARIENLTLVGNRLTDIDVSEIRGIIRLDVRNNNIKCMHPQNVQIVRVIKLDGNPFECDCFKKFMQLKTDRTEVWAPKLFRKCGMSQYVIRDVRV